MGGLAGHRPKILQSARGRSQRPSRGDEPTGVLVASDMRLGANGFGRGADGRGDDGTSHGLRLSRHPAERLRLGRSNDRHVRCEERGGNVVDVADEANPVAQPGRGDLLLEAVQVCGPPLSAFSRLSSAAAAITTLCPFQPVRRAACRMTRSSAPTRQRSRRAATRAGDVD